MRRSLLIALALALALALVAVACAPTAAPGWTYAPPTPAPSVNPSASSGPSAAPSTEASGAPSGAPSASATPSGSGGASTVQVSALNVTFEQQAISAPANAAFTIHFDNKDAGIQHNVEIRDASNMSMYKGEFVTGPAQADYAVPPLPAGAYTFNCTIHPNMTGPLTVGP
jgi:plastocyanin